MSQSVERNLHQRLTPDGAFISNSETLDSWTRSGGVAGGRRLWLHLVIGFSVVGLIGVMFIGLGAAMFSHAYEYEKRHDTSLPMALCIVAVVSGSLMLFGSLIMGKLVITNHGRKVQRAEARLIRRQGGRVYYSSRGGESTDSRSPNNHPPPYELYSTDELRNSQATYPTAQVPALPPPPDRLLCPPEYSESSVKPPHYTSIDPLNKIYESVSIV